MVKETLIANIEYAEKHGHVPALALEDVRALLAEIKRLEKQPLNRIAVALEAIAATQKSMDETLVLILHKLPNANE